ncbi:MAG: flagellar assembly protein FliW [Deltaproteobacteria bacterium]|nr:flagellar assembly protein FliW [Deltaproteobacteria bacterium]
MIIDTTRFGGIEIDENMILTLKGGLLGFTEATSFILIDHAPGSPFRWLQSAQIPELAFVVIDPFEALENYPVEPLTNALKEVGIPEGEEMAVGVIVTFRKGPPGNTVNLLAPLAFAVDSRIGVQTVLHNLKYGTQHPLSIINPGTSPGDESTQNQGRLLIAPDSISQV